MTLNILIVAEQACAGDGETSMQSGGGHRTCLNRGRLV